MADMSSRAAKKLGARIRALRTAQGYTIESFAQALGYSWITVSRYERGKVLPDLERLHHIADTLGVPVTDLLDEGVAA